MIKIENLCFAYGEKQIFRNFSFSIPAGSRICLLGEGGLGKTTLLRLISGLEIPQSGSIVLPENTRFSAVFQEDRLLPFLSILDNCLLVGGNKKNAFKHLEALNIGGASGSKPAALCADFDILLLDEPFTGLDAENVSAAARYISEQLSGRTLIMVSHSPAEAELLGAKEIKISDC